MTDTPPPTGQLAELLPCPLCGQDDALIAESALIEGYVRCRPCKLWITRNHTHTSDGLVAAIVAWNTRAPRRISRAMLPVRWELYQRGTYEAYGRMETESGGDWMKADDVLALLASLGYEVES